MNKPLSLLRHENELLNKFSTMTSQEIVEMMETTNNTTTKLICWKFLQTL